MPTFFIVIFFFILFCYSPAMAFVIGLCALIYCFGVRTPGEKKPSKEEKSFETLKEKQERIVKKYMREDFDPESPENIEETNRLRKVQEENIKQNQKEAERKGEF
jgi:hypothetical protein